MSGNNLSGKIAIVTGSSRGIGAAIASRLAQDGASVVVNYAGSADKAEEVVNTIEASGGRAVAVQADVGKLTAIARLFDETLEKFGKVDILVNNAGVQAYKLIADVTEQDARSPLQHQRQRHVLCLPTGCPLNDGGWAHHQLFHIRNPFDATNLQYLRGNQGGDRADYAPSCERTWTAADYRQLRFPRTNEYAAFHRRQNSRTDRTFRSNGFAGTIGGACGYCPCGRISGK